MKECPTCHRPFLIKGMWCYACEKPIKKRHKFHHVGCYVRHDDCSNPTLRVEQSPTLEELAVDAPLLDAVTGKEEHP